MLFVRTTLIVWTEDFIVMTLQRQEGIECDDANVAIRAEMSSFS